MEKSDLVHFLNQQAWCESLTLREVQTLIDYTDLIDLNKGDIIADIGEVGEALYFVIEGEAGLFIEDKGEAEVGRIPKGELVGEMSFFDRSPRSVRMRATQADTQLLKLTRKKYNRLRLEHPFIAVNLLEHAIVSLDHLFRRVSSDVASYSSYFYGKGKH